MNTLPDGEASVNTPTQKCVSNADLDMFQHRSLACLCDDLVSAEALCDLIDHVRGMYENIIAEVDHNTGKTKENHRIVGSLLLTSSICARDLLKELQSTADRIAGGAK